MACVFDVPEEHMEGVKHVCENEDWLDICTELPPLKVITSATSSGRALCSLFPTHVEYVLLARKTHMS